MSFVRHNLPVLLTLTLILLLVVGIAIWGFLWQRVGMMRATLLATFVFWGTFLLGTLLSPKHRYRGTFTRPRSCTIEFVPQHLLGAVTNQHRLGTVLLFLPLGLLVVVGARGRARLVTSTLIVALPVLVEAAQYSFSALRRPCSTVDVYDGWTGIVAGAALGAVLSVLAHHLRLSDSNARHRQRGPLPTAADVLRVLWPPGQTELPHRATDGQTATFVPSGALRRTGLPDSQHSAPRVTNQPDQHEGEVRRTCTAAES